MGTQLLSQLALADWQHTVISKTPQLQLFSSLFSICSVQVLSRIVYSIYFKYYIYLIYILYIVYLLYQLCSLLAVKLLSYVRGSMHAALEIIGFRVPCVCVHTP